MKINWEITFNTSHHFYGDIGLAWHAARDAGYPLVCWNGRVFDLKTNREVVESIFPEYQHCPISDCELPHCSICGAHIFGPAWGTVVCKSCGDAFREAWEDGSLEPSDFEKYNNVCRIG